jgi:uncharacterized protein (TIGR04222 family)
MVRRVTAWGALVLALLALAAPARAQSTEAIGTYDVAIRIEPDGTLTIRETIEYDFGSNLRHGIFRDIPTRFYLDDTYDRVYPLEIRSVDATGDAPTDLEVTEQGGNTHIRIGDPDEEISGVHTYTIVYTVRGALNPFPEHDELYWNVIGTGFPVPIARARATVFSPAAIPRAECFLGASGFTERCGETDLSGQEATFRAGRSLAAFEGMTVVVALPKGAVPEPHLILDERWAIERAFRVTPATTAGSVGLLALLGAGLGWLLWRQGRDRRFVGSPIDHVMGSDSGQDEPVPLGDADAEAPVEFAPPEDIRPGEVGMLLDERANLIDVTASIVDLAVRGYLRIEELEPKGFLRKGDWSLIRLREPDDDLRAYERMLLDAIFETGAQVNVSDLKDRFAARLDRVERALSNDAVRRGWFPERPERVSARWVGRGLGLTVVGGVITYALARWTHLGLLGLPVVVSGLAMAGLAPRMPARTARGTAMLRRVRGFRRVIATAETHMSRWAEEQHVFTRYLPYAIVFGLTEKWAKAFEGLAREPDTSGWYVGSRPFTYAALADSMDGFTVTTGGTLASTPSSSGSSGFGGGSSGGGGGGGGGGSW